MTDIHSCSYHCDRPECIRAQRDELRERLAQPGQSVAGFCKKIEGLISERDNLRAALAQPEQKPVAWRYKPMVGSSWSLTDDGYYISCKRDKGYIVDSFYAAPPQRKPLTDEAGAVINAARAAMDASTEAQDGKGGIKIASDLAASLSLCLDEYDQAIRARGKHDQR